jgi:hypothetical protein
VFSPWSPGTLLLSDFGLGRVVEVDLATGALVKVWVQDAPAAFGVAATPARLAVGAGWGTGTTSLTLYNLAGVVEWVVGGPEETGLDPTFATAGRLLGGPTRVRFSQDGAYLALGEYSTHRVTLWGAATGAYRGMVGSQTYQGAPYGLAQCWDGDGVGALVASPDYTELLEVDARGVLTASTAFGVNGLSDVGLVPGVGLVLVSPPDGLFLASAVAIADQPDSAVVVVPHAVTFSLTLTNTSATTGVTYVWTLDGAPVGTNAPQYTYTGEAGDAGPDHAVVCRVSHALGRATTHVANLTVLVPPVVVVSPANTTATAGASVEFTVGVDPVPTGPYNVTWTVDGVVVAGNASVMQYTTKLEQGGALVHVGCKVTESYGVVASSTAVLTVQVRAGVWRLEWRTSW